MTYSQKPPSCEGCQCLDHGRDFSEVEGTGANGVMFVGEASGEHEQRDKLPFRPYAPAGAVLQRTLNRLTLSRAAFSITNVLRCRPRNNWLEKSPWEFSAISHCRPNLTAAIQQHKPRAIQPLGTVATREVTGLAGEKVGVTHLAGYVLPYSPRRERCDFCIRFDDATTDPNCPHCQGTGYTDARPPLIPVVPNFHPAYLRRGKAAYQGIFARFLQRAVDVASGRDRDWMFNPLQMPYTIAPTAYDAEHYLQTIACDPRLVISYDIETDESTKLDEDAREGFVDTNITQIQFSTQTGHGIAFPWAEPFISIAQRILHLPNMKCGHNVWTFDNKILRAAGERIGLDLRPRGIIHDTLAMFHHWQPDLMANLQSAAAFVKFPFPWKHMAAANLPFYGVCDVDAALRLFYFLVKMLKQDGIWDDQPAVRLVA